MSEKQFPTFVIEPDDEKAQADALESAHEQARGQTGSYILSKKGPETPRYRYLQAIRLGMFKKDACWYSGISESTIENWEHQAERDFEAGRDTIFTQFILDVRKQRSLMVGNGLRTVQLAQESGDWKAASWMLEVHGYRKQSSVSVDGEVAAKITYTIDNQDEDA